MSGWIGWISGWDEVWALYGIPVTRVSNGQGELADLKSHSLCPNSKVALTHSLTQSLQWVTNGRYRAARAIPVSRVSNGCGQCSRPHMAETCALVTGDLVTTMARAAKNPLDGSIWIRSFLSRYPFALSRQGALVGELASFIQAWSENRRKKVIFGLQFWQLWQSVMFEGKSSSEGPRQCDVRVDRSGQISPLHCLQRKSTSCCTLYSSCKICSPKK